MGKLEEQLGGGRGALMGEHAAGTHEPVQEAGLERQSHFQLPILSAGRGGLESTHVHDLGGPGRAEHGPGRPPSRPRGRGPGGGGPGGRNTGIGRGPPGTGGRGGRGWQEGRHVAAPGSPAAGGHGQGDGWPLQRADPPGRRCSATGQQAPPGWQEGGSGPAQGSAAESRGGVRKRGGAGEDRAGHSP